MIRVILVLAVLPFLLQAQDSTMSVELPEVTVTATRSAVDILESPSPVNVLTVGRGAVLHGGRLSDVLREANSVFLQELGGNGALKTVFLRGTAPQHVLVLVNGLRQNSFQNGLVDLSLYSLDDVQTVEVVRGGSSALYGADALGGVVNVLTRGVRSGFGARVEGGAGSYGYRRWRVESEGRPGNVGILGGIGFESGDDNYSFRPASGGASTRRNSDFRRTNAYLRGDLPLAEGSELRFFSHAVRSTRGVPGPLSFPSDEARQSDDDANIGLEYRTWIIPSIHLVTRASYHYSLQRYDDPNPFFPIHAVYRNGFASLNPEVQFVIGESGRVMAGVERNEGRLTGNDFAGTKRRIQSSIYITSEWRFLREGEFFDALALYGMLRYEDLSDVADVLMPKAGVNVRISRSGNVRLRASYGRSFRAPSFNDLYFVGYSNPDLRPEYSTCADVGLVGEGTTGPVRHRWSATYFDIRTRDRIVFDLASFLPLNIDDVLSTGWEGTYEGAVWDDALTVETGYNITDAIKRNESTPGDPAFNRQLLYIPRHTAFAALSFRLSWLTVRLSHSSTGKRFTNSARTEILPEHHSTDVRATGDLAFGGTGVMISAEIRNLANRSYQVFKDYPMPGRTFRLGLAVHH